MYYEDSYPSVIEIHTQPDDKIERIMQYIASLPVAQRAAAFEHFFGKKSAMGGMEDRFYDLVSSATARQTQRQTACHEVALGTATADQKLACENATRAYESEIRNAQTRLAVVAAAAAVGAYLLFFRKK